MSPNVVPISLGRQTGRRAKPDRGHRRPLDPIEAAHESRMTTRAGTRSSLPHIAASNAKRYSMHLRWGGPVHQRADGATPQARPGLLQTGDSAGSMLRQSKDFQHLAIVATDGAMGGLRAFCFDDEAWATRALAMGWMSTKKAGSSDIGWQAGSVLPHRRTESSS